MGIHKEKPFPELTLPPGFRFYPTDEELIVHYLCKKLSGHVFSLPIIGDIDLYTYNPWDLPDKALFGEKEWYFFSARVKKYPNGSRPNRVAGSGYWKATGSDKIISIKGRKIGVKKSLVFYIGKASKGTKTNWIMHEYRPFESSEAQKNSSSRVGDWVLCRIYKKISSVEKAVGLQSHGSTSSSSLQYEDNLETEGLKQEMGIGGPFSELGQAQQSTKEVFSNIGGAHDWEQKLGLFSHDLDPPSSTDPFWVGFQMSSGGLDFML